MPEISSTQSAAILRGIVRQKAWGVRFTEEGFLMFQFGDKQAPEKTRSGAIVQHGEWNLWIYDATWRLKRNNALFVDCATEPAIGQRQVESVDGLTLIAVSHLSSDRMVIDFEQGVTLEVTANTNADDDQWILFLPNDCVLTAESDGTFSLEQE
jgi:hypothetical protein